MRKMEETNLEVVVEFEFLVSLEDVPNDNDFSKLICTQKGLG